MQDDLSTSDPQQALELLQRRDADWLQVQYDNRARVPDAAQTLVRWAADSALLRQQLLGVGRAQLDLAYGDGPDDRVDAFTPAPLPDDDEAVGAPVLVFIHGGWWRSLGKADFSIVASAFTQAGALVMVPEYSLCPAVTVDGIARQMTRALAWAWRNAERLGGDPRRIVVAGHSAGAHLAAMLLACDWKAVGADLPARLVRGALAISGVYELEPLQHTAFLQADLRLTDEDVARLSPLRHPAPRGGRLFATVGARESESFLAHSQALRFAWGPRTVPVCEAIPGCDHFSVVDDFVQPGGRQHGLAWELLDGAPV